MIASHVWLNWRLPVLFFIYGFLNPVVGILAIGQNPALDFLD